MNPTLYIFDADGTLRRTLVAGQPCPRAPDEWTLIEGVCERLRHIPWSADGPYLGIASNQDQVGYGLLSASMALQLLDAMVMAAVGAITPPPCVRFCPHRIEDSCACRKPAAGMLLDIMDHFRVRPEETVFVGDADADRRAALSAGVAFIHAYTFFHSSPAWPPQP